MNGLTIRDFQAGYPRCPVIRRLTSAGLPAGKITMLLGPNGCGKSTLLRAIAGLGMAQGELWLNGTDIMALPAAQRAARVVYLPQSLPPGVHLRVLESIIAAARATGSPSSDAVIAALLTRLGIQHLALRYLDCLSGGQKQMVGLAQSLIRCPALLLLDEPLSALDLNYQLHVIDLIRRETLRCHMTTIMVVHDINIALRYGDRIIILKEGELVADGEPEQVITPAVLAQVYGVEGRVERCSQGNAQVFIDGLLAQSFSS